MKRLYIFSISRDYRQCTVWIGFPRTHQKLGQSTVTPNKGLTRLQRYEIISKWMKEQCGVKPDYVPTKRELVR